MKKSIKIVLIALVSLLILAYIAGIVFFSMYTYPETYLMESKKGLIDKSEFFVTDSKDYSLKIIGKDKQELMIKSDDIDYSTTVSGKPELKQNVFLWPVEVFMKHQYNPEIKSSFSKEKLKDIVDNSDLIKKAVQPKNAELVYENDDYSIKPEVEGNTLDREKLDKKIVESLNKLEKEIVLKDEYIKPTVYRDDKKLLANLEEMKRLNKNKIVFDFSDRKYELKGKDLLDVFEEKNGKKFVNKEKVREFVQNLAYETDTYGQARKFKATGIGEITVPAGIYGWMMNVDETTDNAVKMLEEGKSGNVEIKYVTEGLHREKDDVQGTYIEIDISRQTMWLYNNGQLVIETPVITGQSNIKYATTPVGVNKVWSKERKRDLVGTFEKSGSSYSYPVEYWMPVGWTGSGIHDTYHRTEYGGDVYTYNGSNSCINTPPAAMATIFENTPLNTPVFIYESSTNNSPTEFERQDQIRSGQTQMSTS